MGSVLKVGGKPWLLEDSSNGGGGMAFNMGPLILLPFLLQ